MKEAILSTAYFGPIQYFSKLINFESILIEKYENFSKQSFRNRCDILGANGVLNLSIPLQKNKNPKTLIKDIKISYDTNWQAVHWKSIVSAYNRSPYFEFYIDDIEPVFNQQETFLFDLNYKILELISELLQSNFVHKISFTEDFVQISESESDYRFSIHPKPRMQKNDPLFTCPQYQQVFTEKFDFKENLSILDLMFNEGPNAVNLIKTSLKTEI